MDWKAFQNTVTQYMAVHGYWTLFLAMAIEGTGLPIPFEFLFIPAGFAVSRGEMAMWAVIGASTAGSLFGNLLGYWLGRWGGVAFISRWGRYFHIDPDRLARVNEWFYRHGGRTVFASRFVGFIRAPSIISAGIFRMDVVQYAWYSALGALVWNGFWASTAWLFGSKLPDMLGRVYRFVGPALLVTAIVGVASFILLRRRGRPSEGNNT